MIPITSPNLNDFALEHYNAIEEHLKRKRINKYSAIDHWFQTNINGLTLRNAILASPSELDRIVNQFHSAPVNTVIRYLKNTLYERFASSGDSIGDNGYNAVKMVQNLNVHVCPYCNRSYINNVQLNKSRTQIRRTCQIDHYHSKDRYPFLSLSFYNLIPACSTCNHLKSNKPISVSPYHRYDADLEIYFDFRIKNAKLADENDIAVDVRHGRRFQGNVDVLRLRDHYQSHNDVVYEVIRKKQMYPASKIDELYNTYGGIFNNRDELLRTLFGNYICKNDMSKRPLAKLTRDIYRSTK